MKNEGKIFEHQFEESIDKNTVLVKRFNDNAASFAGGSNTRFSSTNECDYELFDTESRTLYFLELKTTLNSLTFWREDFNNKNYQIKKVQILGLLKFAKYENTVCGLIINFRNTELNETYFINIIDFVNYTKNLNKKSINIKDVYKMNPLKINCSKKRIHYKYDIDKFINDTKI